MPERGGKAITLLDLATYSSGLRNMPGNLHPNDPANLFADYTLGQLYSFLSNYTLLFDPGSTTSMLIWASGYSATRSLAERVKATRSL